MTFNTNGGTPVAPISASLFSTISKPDSKKGYTLLGWFKDEDCTDEWIFANDIVIGNITLYAKWSNTYDGSLTVGDTGPGGGKVFYASSASFTFYQNANDTTGVPRHYLEAALYDHPSAVQWGNPGILVGTNTTIGSGKRNTDKIMQTFSGDFAAQACVSKTDGGFKDWFLPSRDELVELWNKRLDVGNFSNSASTFYWSSSEEIINYVWTQKLSDWAQTTYGTTSTHSVRAVRAF